MIIDLLHEVMNKMNIYYKINEDIINNYENKNRNYETIYILNKIKNNNIIEELKNIINGNIITEKFNNIFNLYSKMNINEITLIYSLGPTIYVFGEEFYKRYKNLLKIEIEGKEIELKEKYNFSVFSLYKRNLKKKDEFQIKLKGIINITDMSNMFDFCENLVSLPDISKMNTNNITNMSSMFKDCRSLSSLPDISNWNTSSVIDLSHIFENCESLETLPEIGKWETFSLVDMSYAFKNCISLTNALDNIIKWKFPKVTNMSGIFYNCKKLSPKNGINWKLPEIIDKKSIIEGCPTELIEKIMGIKYNASVNDKNCFIY